MKATMLFIHKHSRFILAATILLMFLGVFVFGSVRRTSATTNNVKYYTCITVNADDTLWSIADTYITSEYKSIKQYINEVKSINNLSSDKIYYGATLVVPYYAAP